MTDTITGVTYREKIGKWRARIRVNGKQIELGLYRSKEKAIQARIDAEEKYFYHLVQYLESSLSALKN